MMTTAIADAPRDNLLRARMDNQTAGPLTEVRDDSGDGRQHLVGHFAVFNEWSEIDSWEGRFLERLAPGSARKTIREQRDSVKVLFDHGHDPTLGNKPLGPIVSLSEDPTGVSYDVSLIDTDYNRDFIVPAAREGLLGASFRFSVVKETWVEPARGTDWNPNKIRERTIQEFRLFEFGPVTFPAYQQATAGLRSKFDVDLWQRLDERGRASLFDLFRQAHNLDTSNGEPLEHSHEEPSGIQQEPADATSASRRDRIMRVAKLKGLVPDEQD